MANRFYDCMFSQSLEPDSVKLNPVISDKNVAFQKSQKSLVLYRFSLKMISLWKNWIFWSKPIKVINKYFSAQHQNIFEKKIKKNKSLWQNWNEAYRWIVDSFSIFELVVVDQSVGKWAKKWPIGQFINFGVQKLNFIPFLIAQKLKIIPFLPLTVIEVKDPRIH